MSPANSASATEAFLNFSYPNHIKTLQEKVMMDQYIPVHRCKYSKQNLGNQI